MSHRQQGRTLIESAFHGNHPSTDRMKASTQPAYIRLSLIITWRRVPLTQMPKLILAPVLDSLEPGQARPVKVLMSEHIAAKLGSRHLTSPR
jgi:hypothetical protein